MRSLTYLFLVVLAIFALSLSSCSVGRIDQSNKIGKFYLSSGVFRNSDVPIVHKDTNIIYISNNKIAIYYEEEHRNLFIDVEPMYRSRNIFKYEMECCNDVFTINIRTAQFYISKKDHEGKIGEPYIIFYNLKEIKR